MTLDFWGLGLQAINVLVLIWLLSRVFWRPVAAAIATRQETATAIIKTAKATQAKADAALTEATQARAEIADDRADLLEAAKAEAHRAASAVLAEARRKADALLATAKTTIAQDTETARKANAAQASDLALDIAGRLLTRLNGPAVQSEFLTHLTKAITDLPAATRAALRKDPTGIEILTATEVSDQHETIKTALLTALGGETELRFTVDPDLIGGMDLRSPHFVLHNSWQSDLTQVRKAVQNAA
jgi:F-type H+-transporting ATPase subunit b